MSAEDVKSLMRSNVEIDVEYFFKDDTPSILGFQNNPVMESQDWKTIGKASHRLKQLGRQSARFFEQPLSF